MDKGKILMIIAPKNFRDEELKVPKSIFENNDYRVEITSLTKEKAKGMFGLEATPDITVEGALRSVEKYKGVIVVGGSGSPQLAERQEVLELLKRAEDRRLLIGAICLGPLALAQAGVLEDKSATIWCSEKNKEPAKKIEKEGAKYKEEPVVVDEDLVTANGPQSAKLFAEKVLKRLE